MSASTSHQSAAEEYEALPNERCPALDDSAELLVFAHMMQAVRKRPHWAVKRGQKDPHWAGVVEVKLRFSLPLVSRARPVYRPCDAFKCRKSGARMRRWPVQRATW